VWLRRALFQVHLWSGIGLGLYVFFISVTGSVLVYRNELYVWAAPPEETKVGLAFWLVGKLIELHDDLLSGQTGHGERLRRRGRTAHRPHGHRPLVAGHRALARSLGAAP